MGTIFRTWSYQYQWLYDGVSGLATLPLGGIERFHRLPLRGLELAPDAKILDLCCGSGQATRYLVELSPNVTGLDASPLSLGRAARNVPQAEYVEALAEEMPFAEGSFDLVHSSVAMHEMETSQLQQIFREIYRVLKPGGIFAMVDLNQPTNPLFLPGLWAFLWLFETQTAWTLLETNLVGLLRETGFQKCDRALHAGGSIQVIHAQK